VTGTDTAVGKTVIALALVALLRRRGLRVAAMKPVETGVALGQVTDAMRLREAAGSNDAPADVCPLTFPDALAPLVAAERVGSAVDIDRLDAAFARLTAGRDAVVVEGAGGLLVPLSERISYADLFARWRLGLVLVAANRLGAINHVRLTVQGARAAGVSVQGVVLNHCIAGPPDLAAATNPAAVARLLPGIPVLTWPWLARVSDDGVLAAQAERSGLARLDGERREHG
jgi:dethiobiotin synthetase